jgi:hypothetical protein
MAKKIGGVGSVIKFLDDNMHKAYGVIVKMTSPLTVDLCKPYVEGQPPERLGTQVEVSLDAVMKYYADTVPAVT